jgi:LacI family transcriptional regulator
MVYGVEERAREMGYNLLLINTNEDIEYEEKTINLLHSKMVDGIICHLLLTTFNTLTNL